MTFKRLITFSIFLGSFFSFAQEGNDLGLIFSRNNYSNIGAEYRHGLTESSKLTAGAFYGSYSSFFGSFNSKIISASDTSIVQRNYQSAHDCFSLRLGYEKEIINMFSLGGGLLLDYQRSFSGSNDTYTSIDSEGNWSYPTYYSNIYTGFGQNDSTWAGVYHHYFKPGVQLYASMNIPLGDRFLLNLSAACAMQYWFYLGESNKHDPNNEFNYEPGGIFSFDTRLNIGLRYKFGVGKNQE